MTHPALLAPIEPPYIAVLYGKKTIAFTRLSGKHVIVEIREGWKVPIPLPEWARWVTMDRSGAVVWWVDCDLFTTQGMWHRCGVPRCGDDVRRFSGSLVTVQDPERYDWRACIVEIPS